MKFTPNARRALEIVRENPGIRPAEFALLFWGREHPGFRRATKAGRGSTRGGGMRLSAGGYLGKLRGAGWIAWRIKSDLIEVNGRLYRTETEGNFITREGEALLQSAETV